MASIRRNVVLTEGNYQWTIEHAPNEKALSHFINNLLQKERTLGPIESRMQRQADRMDLILSHGQRS